VGRMKPVERFYQAIAKSVIEKPKKGIHVSHIARDCLRHSYYEKHLGVFLTPYTILNFWRGQRLHEPPILQKHELELEWNGIHATIDEYENGLLLDKKTVVGDLPKEVPPETARQLEYYSVILTRNRYPVKEIQVLYISLRDNKLQFLTIKPRSRKQVEKEMLARKKILLGKGIPDRNPNDQYCLNCAYGLQCFTMT